MPTQKIFKQRVRARMTKTGESYTAARHQLLRKAIEPGGPALDSVTNRAEPVDPAGASSADASSADASSETAPTSTIPHDAVLVADEAMVRATGRGHADWFALLDAWSATDHNHTEIARWLSETHGTPGWWTQNLTVAYERARGMRARHQQADGYSVSITRTINVEPDRALAAFTDPSLRRRWLADAPMRQRPTRAALTARFDWFDPASRVVVAIVPKGDRSTVAVAHERVPDAETAERLKAAWRGWLGDLKAWLEQA